MSSDDSEGSDWSSSEDEALEQSLLAEQNEQLRQERAILMEKFVTLTELVEQTIIGQEKEVFEANQELQQQLESHREMLQSLMALLPDSHSDQDPGIGDVKSSLSALLSDIADEAELKVMALLAASQNLIGGRWKRAKYNPALGLPEFFSDLKMHYMLGEDHLQIRFDAFFPGFAEKVVAEILWRVFGSQEYSRRITSSECLNIETVDEMVLDPRTGARAKVIRFDNKLKEPEGHLQEAVFGCSRRRRTLAKSTLATPRVGFVFPF